MSSGRRRATSPRSRASAASWAPMMRTPSGVPGSRSSRSSGLKSWSSLTVAPGTDLGWAARWPRSDLEQFLLFVLERLVDLGFLLVGELVELLLRTLELVGGDVAFLLELLQIVPRG